MRDQGELLKVDIPAPGPPYRLSASSYFAFAVYWLNTLKGATWAFHYDLPLLHIPSKHVIAVFLLLLVWREGGWGTSLLSVLM